MPTSSHLPARQAEFDDLERTIRRAVEAETGELAAHLATADDAHPSGKNASQVGAIAPEIAAEADERHLARKETDATAPG